MPSFVALLRGINVGGHAPVAMADLRQLLESLGFLEVKTLLQSGNVIFKGKAKPSDRLEKMLEGEALKRWKIPIDILIREASDWPRILAANPFGEEAARDPGHLTVMFLRDIPTPEALAALKDAIRGSEYFQGHGRELYIYYPDGMGNSRFAAAVIEKKLGTRGTARNWNTVQKIAALLPNA